MQPAALATSPADLTGMIDAAIAVATEGFAKVKAAGAEPLDLLDGYDEAMAALGNAANHVDLFAVAHPDAAMRAAAEVGKQTIAKVITDASLDRELYDLLATLDVGDADGPTRYFLDTTLRDFRRAGVDRDESTRARIRELHEELVVIGQTFGRNIRSDTRTAWLDADALDGLPEDYRRTHPVVDGRVAISTDHPDLVPFMRYSTSPGARRQMWSLFRQRGHPANIDVLQRLIERRHELATRLGYPSWAAYVTEDKMIGSAVNVAAFIDTISRAAAERARRDYDRLLARKRRDEPDATQVWPWDSTFLDDRIKAEELAFDTQTLRPYFEYNRVKMGVMRLVERLFELRFTPRPEIAGWHPDVECHDVYAATTGEWLGRIYLDMHPRADKFQHAAMYTMVNGKAGRRIPQGALVCNLPRPGEQPALLQHSEVTTFFHEFGHLVHHILGGHGRWSGTSGISTEWDFVEAPSQLLEEWVRDAHVLAAFAVHERTGEPLAAEQVAKLRAAEELGKGMFVQQQMFYAALSLHLHDREPVGLDPATVESQAWLRFTPYPLIEGTYVHLGFGHLVTYSAIYCTYMWSLVIAKDLFTAFARDGLLSGPTAARYRERVLAPGGSAPAATLVAHFLGRPYTFEAYRAWLDSG
jgi:thimet oligopeptidase